MKNKIIEILISTGREGIADLIVHMEGNGFFTAPCSGQYHLCREGGLMEHSLNVYEFGCVLVEGMTGNVAEKFHLSNFHSDINTNWAIVSLLHDIGKSDYHYKPNYVPNILTSGKISTAKPYETNKDRLYIPHEVVSLQIINNFIQLTEDEEFSIYYHNGLYVKSGYDLMGKERPLQQLLHFSDMWASRFVEKEDK